MSSFCLFSNENLFQSRHLHRTTFVYHSLAWKSQVTCWVWLLPKMTPVMDFLAPGQSLQPKVMFESSVVWRAVCWWLPLNGRTQADSLFHTVWIFRPFVAMVYFFVVASSPWRVVSSQRTCLPVDGDLGTSSAVVRAHLQVPVLLWELALLQSTSVLVYMWFSYVYY